MSRQALRDTMAAFQAAQTAYSNALSASVACDADLEDVVFRRDTMLSNPSASPGDIATITTEWNQLRDAAAAADQAYKTARSNLDAIRECSSFPH